MNVVEEFLGSETNISFKNGKIYSSIAGASLFH